MAADSPRGGLAARLAADLASLDTELTEIDLLITQATAEAERHEQKRAAASDRLDGARTAGEAPADLIDQAAALVKLTRRASLMEAQVDVLTGKRKVLGRYRDALAQYAEGLAASGGAEAADGAPAVPAPAGPDPASRLVLAAQEELRREIARAMHDGPAQSLTNIVLQAQIVERLVERNPSAAQAEVRELIAMVQRTLDATKSFIFEVRPMVLDDLGLVPTLRGTARDRGRRAGVPVTFESLGPDRRLPTDIESALFRLLDDSLAAFLALRPDQVALDLDWGDQLTARLRASRAETEAPAAAAPAAAVPAGTDIPPALAAMIAQRRDDEVAAEAKARDARRVVLPAAAWDEIRARSAALGIAAEQIDDGSGVQLTADLGQLAGAAAAP